MTSVAPSAPLTRIIGRDQDLAAILSTLQQTATQLITLTGPGGVGKTRLAQEVMNCVSSHAETEPIAVSLASLTDPALVPREIAKAIGLSETLDNHIDDLRRQLESTERVLFLDNFEHLITAASVVADLIDSCPTLKILVTSREPLRIEGEHEYPVAPLSVPDVHREGIRTASTNSAVALFVERAQGVRASFELNTSNTSAVVEICRRLDGLPLAIELAAARIKILSPAALSERLSNRFDVLGVGSRDLPTRQQTIGSTIAWSYDLLPPEEQLLFRRLSVFATFTEVSATALVARLHAQHRPTTSDDLDPLDGIASLVEKSLIRRIDAVDYGDGEPRYAMLETIREFGWGLIVDSDEGRAVRSAHAAWCLDLTNGAVAGLRGAQHRVWLDKLDAEHADIRRALRWMVENKMADAGHRVIGNIWPFWEARGHLTEGRSWCDHIFALPGDVDPIQRARAFIGASSLPYRQGDYDRAMTLAEEALRQWRAIGDPNGIGDALNALGNITFDRGEFEASAQAHLEAKDLRRSTGNRNGYSASLNNLGVLRYEQGRYAEALAIYEESYALWIDTDDQVELGYSCNGLGRVSHQLGDLDAAERYLLHAIELRRNAHAGALAASLTNLAAVVVDLGDPPRATTLYQEALSLRAERGEKRGLGEALAGLAILVAQSQPEFATQLFGAVEQLRISASVRLPPAVITSCDRATANLRSSLGSEAFNNHFALGQARDMSDVCMLSLAFSLPETPSRPPAPRPETPDLGLTSRELDVLRLIAEGQRDQEIADQLSISLATARRHAANIYTKLNVNSRAAAANLAYQHGIVER